MFANTSMSSFKIQETHWQIFYDFFTRHPGLATGRINARNGGATHQKLWAELTFRLNSAGLGSGSLEKWRKSWADFKSALKKKVFDSRVLGKDLSDLETKFVTLLELTNYNYMGVSGACLPNGLSNPTPANHVHMPGPSTYAFSDHVTMPTRPNDRYTSRKRPIQTHIKPTPKRQKVNHEEMHRKTVTVLEKINVNLDNCNKNFSRLANAVEVIGYNIAASELRREAVTSID